jgi:hypothetical protein
LRIAQSTIDNRQSQSTIDNPLIGNLQSSTGNPRSGQSFYRFAEFSVVQRREPQARERRDRDGAKKTLESSAKYAVQPQHTAAVKRLLERLAAGQGIG